MNYQLWGYSHLQNLMQVFIYFRAKKEKTRPSYLLFHSFDFSILWAQIKFCFYISNDTSIQGTMKNKGLMTS